MAKSDWAKLAVIAAAFGSLVSSASASATNYIAYRASTEITEAQWTDYVSEASALGLNLVRSRELDSRRLIVFADPQDAILSDQIEKLYTDMIQVPVQSYQDRPHDQPVLSVHSGYFYLRFAASVSEADARKRLESAGFTILSPRLDAIIVVKGSMLPSEKGAELSQLKALSDLVYAAPDDIVLPR